MLSASPDAVLESAVADRAVPGVVGAVTDTAGTIFAAACGEASVSARTPVEIDSVFRIASMTKLVTSLAVVMLHDDGLVDLDGPLADYVPGYRQPEVLVSFDARTREYRTRPAAHAVTLRQLLTHTSGYGYWFLDEPLRALVDGVPDLLHPPFLMHEPGTRFAYGTSTDVLGQLVEPVAGVPLDRFFAERIFAPLGMRDTGFAVPADASRLVRVHARSSAGFVDTPNETRGNDVRGGGGLYSTAHDYLCLLRLLLDRGRHDGARLVSEAGVEAIASNQIGTLGTRRQTTVYPDRAMDFAFMDGTQTFGLGVLIETVDRDGGRRAGSFGWGGILNTYFWVDPATGVAGVWLAQLRPFCDPACLALYGAFERAVYGRLERGPAPGSALK